ncbi:Vacuolar protein sorting-associated protein 17 [Malassezia sp. CBS 17886]|nr:Vacuolar protein sorting-associated protein 17 [Malassezia sp. CBS 17886]
MDAAERSDAPRGTEDAAAGTERMSGTNPVAVPPKDPPAAEPATAAPTSPPPPERQRPAWYINVGALAISRAQEQISIRFECETNIPSFHRTKYTDVERTYEELATYASILARVGPTAIVPALPLPTAFMLLVTDAEAGDKETFELHELRELLTQWLQRVFQEPALRAHKETRRFIEASYSYQPEALDVHLPAAARRQHGKALAHVQSLAHVYRGAHLLSDTDGGAPGSSPLAVFLGIASASPGQAPAAFVPLPQTGTSTLAPDPDEDLALARGEVTRLEGQLGDAARAFTRVMGAQQDLSAALQDLATKLQPLATLEESRAVSLRAQYPRTLRSAQTMCADIAQLTAASAHAEIVHLGDAMAYQELNLRAAKHSLQERASIVAEHDLAQRVTSNKRQEADALRMAPNVRSDRVDVALAEIREAHHYEVLLGRYLKQVSAALRESLGRHSVNTHCDLQHAMRDYARSSRAFEQRICDALALFDSDQTEVAAEAQRAAIAAATTKRKTTPAQAAVNRVLGKETPAEDAGGEAQSVDPRRDDAEEASVWDSRGTDEEIPALLAVQPPPMESPDWDTAPSPPRDAASPPVDAADHAPRQHAAAGAGASATNAFSGPSSPPPAATRQRGAGGQWSRLSAADAAKTLGGTF